MKKVGLILLTGFLLFACVNKISAKEIAMNDLSNQYILNTVTGDNLDKNTTGSYSKVTCGEIQIPALAPKITSQIINVLQILVPIIIIIVGSLDLVKAVIAGKDDEIKKGQQTFLKRLLVGALVFLVVVLVEFIIGIFVPKSGENANMWNCVNCFITGDCSEKDKTETDEEINEDTDINDNESDTN